MGCGSFKPNKLLDSIEENNSKIITSASVT